MLIPGQILRISIYFESSNIHKASFGATVYSGVANLQDILQAEVTGKHAQDVGGERLRSDGSKPVPEEELESGKKVTGNGEMLVTVSSVALFVALY